MDIMNTLLNITVNTNTRKNPSIAAFVPARVASLRLLSSVDSRSAQPGLFNFATPLLLRQVRIAVDARCSMRSAHLLLKGDENGTVNLQRKYGDSIGRRGRAIRSLLLVSFFLPSIGVEKSEASVPKHVRLKDMNHKLPKWMKIVKKKNLQGSKI